MDIPSQLACILCFALVLPGPAQAQTNQAPPPLKLNIVIVEGEGATNNIRQRVAREPIVEVRDQNNTPISGAAVAFVLPNTGAGGTFANGSRLLTVLTDSNGRAAMRGFTPNNVSGNFQVRVTASFRGDSVSTTISQTNASAPSGPGHGRLYKIAAVAGGAAAVGIAVALTRGGENPKISSQGVSVTRP